MAHVYILYTHEIFRIPPTLPQGYIFWPFPPPPRGSKVKNREEFERGFEIRKGKGGKEEKKEKRDKTHVKINL